MKKFFIKISATISSFFQKLSKKKNKKTREDYEIQELYGIPPTMLNKIENEEERRHQKLYGPPPARNENESSRQELYGIPASMLKKDNKEEK